MIQWERLKSSGDTTVDIYRARVPGGWLVLADSGEHSITFYPDPHHQWDGSSLTSSSADWSKLRNRDKP